MVAKSSIGNPFTIVIVSTTALLLSYSKRKWRAENLTALENASSSKDFFLSATSNSTSTTASKLKFHNTETDPRSLKIIMSENLSKLQSHLHTNTSLPKSESLPSLSLTPKRELKGLLNTIHKAGLFGVFEPTDTTQTKLAYIRKWHTEHGYQGNVIVRDLKEPMFYHDCINSNTQQERVEDKNERRECYYIYYEPNSEGGLHQEIYIRGTAQIKDLTSSIQAMFLYDSDLKCNLHYGFRKHADFMLQDLQFILPKDPKNTIELCGHSMGGSVALILAMKLRLMGYNVKRVTTIGSPKICDDPLIVQNKLPLDTLRVEHERDFITFLPPHGKHVGNKLWFVNDNDSASPTNNIKTIDQNNPNDINEKVSMLQEKDTHNSEVPQKMAHAKYLPSMDVHNHHGWVDSMFINFNVLDLLKSTITKHRIPSYIQQMENLINEAEQNAAKNDEDIIINQTKATQNETSHDNGQAKAVI